jgi:hypothetical protein
LVPSRKRRPHRRARRVLAGRLVVVAIENVERLPCRSSVPCPRRFRFRHGVPVGVDGVRPDTTGQAVSETLSDRGVHGGRRTRPRGHRTGTRLADVPASSTGAGGHDGQVPMLIAARGAEGNIRIAVLSGQGEGVQAAWLAVTSWPDAWSDAGCWRCPPLSRRRPDGVHTHRLDGHIELGMSGRPDAREVRHVRYPASHCRVSAGGTDRRRRCPSECPAAASWRKRAPRRTAGMSGTPWRGPSGAYRAVQG